MVFFLLPSIPGFKVISDSVKCIAGTSLLELGTRNSWNPNLFKPESLQTLKLLFVNKLLSPESEKQAEY